MDYIVNFIGIAIIIVQLVLAWITFEKKYYLVTVLCLILVSFLTYGLTHQCINEALYRTCGR